MSTEIIVAIIVSSISAIAAFVTMQVTLRIHIVDCTSYRTTQTKYFGDIINELKEVNHQLSNLAIRITIIETTWKMIEEKRKNEEGTRE